MVLAVTGYVWEQGVGAVFSQDRSSITADETGSAAIASSD